ncbi:uncharacterized protein C1orf94 homolog isoform X3 [Heterocephalus glaber]|uniref:Uncharacterized protein C1orf94 homolog isoform X3 n=1 Tax=Heterocephalus glaber TaxID=10181 RepID=A0AAX6TF37_HETGA|nr:uncharacterized protein C1orf94 homolog isoform X3 [Heterocephalus glaber]
MASGNGLPSSSALVVKRPSALGPFPRFVWIHQDTPRDSLDKTCHEIWKKVQDLPEALQPETSMEQLSALTAGTPRDYCLGFQEEAPELSRDRDEISLLVEQEFLSLTKEHLILVPESSEELKATSDDPQGTRELAPCVLAPLLVARSSECPGASLTDGDRLQEQKVAMSIIGRQQDCDSAMSTATGILCAAKIRGANGMEDGDHSLGDCTSEISKLLTQFPLKSMEMSKAPDDKMVLKETRVIKDFLQNSIFSDSGPTEPMGLGPFRLVPPPPPPPPPDKLADELPAQKNQLPVFAKICSNTEADPATEGHHLIEWNPGIKESTKSQESLFLSQWPESQKDTCGEESHSDPVSTMPTKKPAWPDEKNLLCKFLGTTKNNPSGQLKLCNKVEVDGLELKCDTLQHTADGPADLPLFLHPPAELHPLCPAQLPVPTEDTSKAAHQSPRPFPHGRRRAEVPLPPRIPVHLDVWWAPDEQPLFFLQWEWHKVLDFFFSPPTPSALGSSLRALKFWIVQ